MPLTIRSILTAFSPAQEIIDPERFSGRRDQVERGCQLLLSHDHIFLHGIRGIGKSSLARQLALIASGDLRLLQRVGSDYARESFDYVTAFLTRDDSILNVNQLLYRLLLDDSALGCWRELCRLPPLPTYQLPGNLNGDLVAEFWRRAAAAAALTRDGLAIFVDEFERIGDHNGFASLVKAAPKNVIFVLTGIAKTERELVRDHESIRRQLDTGRLHLPEMSEEELRLIVQQAENDIGQEIRYDEGAISSLVRVARGHPYLLHLVGRASMVRAFRGKRSSIDRECVDLALTDVATGKIENFLEERYLTAIGNSPQREVVLRVFAESNSDPIPTQEVYPIARSRGVGNPSYWVGDLQKQQFGAEIEKVADQYYRVGDSLFRAYVLATAPRLGAPSPEVDTPTKGVPGKFSLIHMSDVHFGEKHYFTSLPDRESVPVADRPTFERYFIKAMAPLSEEDTLDMLVISGDITQRALSSEFAEARAAVRQLLPHLDAPEDQFFRRLVLVPGNHDVNWGMFKADPTNRSIPFNAYIQFANEFGVRYDQGVEPERLFNVYDHRDDLGAIVVALNSAVVESPDDHRGYIGESQLDNAFGEVNRLREGNDCVVIAVLHHHLVPVSSLEQSLKTPDLVLQDAAHVKEQFLERGVRLVLHGHRHHSHAELVSNGRDAMVIVGCGSTGVVQEERGAQPLQFNRINIVRGERLTIQVSPWSFDVSRRQWLPMGGRERAFQL